jgi:beta-1,2-mannosidase
MISRVLLAGTLMFLYGCEIHAQKQTGSLPEWTIGPFTRVPGVNPVLSPDTTNLFTDPMSGKKVAWESNDTFNPAAAVSDGKVVLLYRAEDRFGEGIGFRTSRLGYAVSHDGKTFIREKQPVFYPDKDSQKEYEWPGGCEDPRIAMTDDGTYVMFYTQWNRKLPRLGAATSKDLKHWQKHGPIFRKAYKGRFQQIAHKSASIITKVANNRQTIAKINGKYYMYWGELGVYIATSENLVDWTPLVDKNDDPIPLISPRKGFFDSDLTECGPPAVMTAKGIVLLYNGKNNRENGDKRYNGNAYAGGQVLFDKNDPTKVLARLDHPFLYPRETFEKSGQYAGGTVFMEGLVYFKNKWFLYYGCADSRVGVASFDPESPGQPDPIPPSSK